MKYIKRLTRKNVDYIKGKNDVIYYTNQLNLRFKDAPLTYQQTKLLQRFVKHLLADYNKSLQRFAEMYND